MELSKIPAGAISVESGVAVGVVAEPVFGSVYTAAVSSPLSECRKRGLLTYDYR